MRRFGASAFRGQIKNPCLFACCVRSTIDGLADDSHDQTSVLRTIRKTRRCAFDASELSETKGFFRPYTDLHFAPNPLKLKAKIKRKIDVLRVNHHRNCLKPKGNPSPFTCLGHIILYIQYTVFWSCGRSATPSIVQNRVCEIILSIKNLSRGICPRCLHGVAQS